MMSAADVHAPPKSLLFFAPRSLANSRPSSPIHSHFSHGRSQSVPQQSLPDPNDEDDDEPLRMGISETQRPVSLTYGVSSFGRGITSDWKWASSNSSEEAASEESASTSPSTSEQSPECSVSQSPSWTTGFSILGSRPRSISPPPLEPEPQSSRPTSPPIATFITDEPMQLLSATSSQHSSRPSSPRMRRRDSAQRVSLVAGRLSMVSIHPPPSPPPRSRVGSGLSIVSVAPPTPAAVPNNISSNGRSIDQFQIDGEAGRGAYGVVKRARERLPDGSLGEPVILKQVVKSRILADCWKKHPRLGTIPIEIYVMSAISNTPYTLPYPRRAWDPQRAFVTGVEPPPRGPDESVMGHPSICHLIEFWEDAHFYYLVLPNAHPNRTKDAPGDLFDLVETYPNGLPVHLIRSYLGQLADATAFLHAKGIVHRDIKDENVVLAEPNGSCVLIDFGSSGVVRRAGWDTFSGTLDYAAPEILEGSRYMGKEQDVWAFGVVAFVLLVGECPFGSKGEAHAGLGPPPSASPSPEDEDPTAAFLDPPHVSAQPTKAGRALAGRCAGVDPATGLTRAFLGLEPDGGGALGDAAGLVRACLQVDPAHRPTFDELMQSKFLGGGDGWTEWVPGWPFEDVEGLGVETDGTPTNDGTSTASANGSSSY